MKMQQLEPEQYFATLQRIVQKVQEKLTQYLDTANEENVHDVRTSIRRLESAWRIMPKKLREKPKIRDFVVAYKELFKTNSQIRDFDVISKRISSNSTILELIESKKKKKMILARRRAEHASSMRFPSLTVKDISSAKLERRFNKITYRLVERIQMLIPKAVEDEKNVSELHELRKNCKKLRYLLELVDDSTSSDFVNHLKQVQDSLGAIHDIDITVDFLHKLPRKYKVDTLVKSECDLRSVLYQKFVQEYKSFKL